ncbi:MAG: hypothetical protein ACI90V_002765, partial [Bacillariaceae sp.]
YIILSVTLLATILVYHQIKRTIPSRVSQRRGLVKSEAHGATTLEINNTAK